jgi:predicted ester cyclase
MTVFQNMEVVRCLMEAAWGRGEVRVIPILVDPDYVGHLPIGDHYGPEGVRIDIAAYRAAFPDLVVTLDDLIAKGDKVVRRFTLCGSHRRPFLDIPATGKPVALRGIAIDRLVGGCLVESWVHVDHLAQNG